MINWARNQIVGLTGGPNENHFDYQELSVGDHTAEFVASNQSVIDETLSVYRMEKEYLEEIMNQVRNDDVFYDIGAHLGVHASFVAKKAVDGEVIAFEPDPKNVEYLSKNLERNRVDGEVVPLAVSNEQGISNFRQPRNSQDAGSQIGSITPNRGDIEVETAPLDVLIQSRNIKEPNIVKIDVEGAEPLVLEGMKHTLANRTCRVVFLEVHLPTPKVERLSIKEFDASLIEIMDFFREFGFDVALMEARPSAVHLQAERP